jgi:hypothetical protein
MYDLNDFDQHTLFDMLAEYTSEYTHLLSAGATMEELSFLKKLIMSLTVEIEKRKSSIIKD